MMIIVVLGLPGSGKSYFAQALAMDINAHYLNSDLIRNEKGARGKYSTEDKMLVYQTMAEKARQIVLTGNDVVVDGTFYLAATVDLFRTLSSTLATAIVFISIVAHEQLIRERLSQVRKDSEANYDVYLKIKEVVEPLEVAHLTLQSSKNNIDDMLSRAKDYIQTRRND
jgi:predicted kinase